MHLLMQADSAMYRVKQEGRDGVRFYLPAMGEAARRDLALQNRLHEALERGELELFWQPQSGRERRVIGFEGLLRWKHPEEGVLEAREFIPLAERTGLIRPIGDWVLDQACRFLARLGAPYPQAGPLHVSINIAPRELRQEAFARRPLTARRTWRAKRRRLVPDRRRRGCMAAVTTLLWRPDWRRMMPIPRC
ncbi:MAG: EAL domain-containing protein [Candidatus Sedimenticola endophacoides]